jgi:hypothetical protein
MAKARLTIGEEYSKLALVLGGYPELFSVLVIHFA